MQLNKTNKHIVPNVGITGECISPITPGRHTPFHPDLRKKESTALPCQLGGEDKGASGGGGGDEGGGGGSRGGRGGAG